MFINLTAPEGDVARFNVLRIVLYQQNKQIELEKGEGTIIVTTDGCYIVKESPKQIDAMIDYLTLTPTSNERRYR